jgi:hypothetical protein
MKLLITIPLVSVSVMFTMATALVHTHTFRQLGSGRYNISVERSVGDIGLPHRTLKLRAEDDTDKERWNKAVCKGGELLNAMAGDERRAGNWFKVPKESGESKHQDYSKLLLYSFKDTSVLVINTCTKVSSRNGATQLPHGTTTTTWKSHCPSRRPSQVSG